MVVEQTVHFHRILSLHCVWCSAGVETQPPSAVRIPALDLGVSGSYAPDAPVCPPVHTVCYRSPVLANGPKQIRTRLILGAIILATLPCYCLGGIILGLKPGEPTPTATPTILLPVVMLLAGKTAHFVRFVSQI